MAATVVVEFQDRADAGRKLAEVLREYTGRRAVVYALPRGGVAVGVEVARRLRAPLDVILARKIGHPRCPEYAIGAVTAGGDLVVNPGEVARLDAAWLQNEVTRQRSEAQRRRKAYTGAAAAPAVGGKIAILVDDGLATGLTMKAAIRAVQRRQPAAVVVAVPVAPKDTIDAIAPTVDRVVCLWTPPAFSAIGEYYRNFEQVEDAQVIALLHRAGGEYGGVEEQRA